MLPESSAMGIDSNTNLSWPPSSHRRVSLTPARLRLKEERKRIIRALDAKYRTIDVLERERRMRRSVLIRNNLLRLQREAREEKLARHRASLGGSRVSNLSPSCLSASRPRSPSPPCDYGFTDTLSPLFGEDPPVKRQRLFYDDDKENEMEVDDQEALSNEPKTSNPCRPIDDAQEILRDLYETCVSEGITQIPSCPSLSSDAFSAQTQQTTSFSLSMSASCSVSPSLSSSSSSSSSSSNNSCNGNSNTSSCESDWPKHSQYPFNCGHSSLLGTDLQSVVFHSLITSLES